MKKRGRAAARPSFIDKQGIEGESGLTRPFPRVASKITRGGGRKRRPCTARLNDVNRLLPLASLAAALLSPACAAKAASVPAGQSFKSDRMASRAHRATASTTAAVNSRHPVTAAKTIAERFWGATPCGGQIRIIADRKLAAGLEPRTDGWVTFNSAFGANNLNAPASSYTDCTISLAHWQWGTWTEMESDWGMFCLTITHEMGHLLGYKHTPRSGSVMNPVFTNDADVPSACHSAWLPGWRQPGER